MSNFLTKILGDKNEWKSMEARADALPRDYRIVYAEIMQYMWRFTSGDGMGHRRHLEGRAWPVRDLRGRGQAGTLDVTGADVAAFCDEHLRGTRSHIGKWRESLNRDVLRQLGHPGPRD